MLSAVIRKDTFGIEAANTHWESKAKRDFTKQSLCKPSNGSHSHHYDPNHDLHSLRKAKTQNQSI